MSKNKPDFIDESSTSNLPTFEHKSRVNKIAWRIVQTLLRWMPIGASSWVFFSYLREQNWFLAVIIFPVMILTAIWTAHTKSFLGWLGELFEQQGKIYFYFPIVWSWNFPGMIIIPNNEIGIVFKKFGAILPSGKKIAINGEKGYQADILSPGHHFNYFSWLYEIKIEPIINIPQGEIGLVVAKDGEIIPNDRILGKVVECNYFQDARAFLANGGEKGRQLSILTSGEYQINKELFTVITASNAHLHNLNPVDLKVYEIPSDTIGIVTTKDGKTIPAEEIAGTTIKGHNKFQNPQKFIDLGGFKGLQEEIIPSGYWNLNPWFVNVEHVPLTYIPSGTVGVVISHVSKVPQKTADDNLVELGEKGIWNNPLYPGKHTVNTRVMDIVIVPTHEITLHWSNRQKPATNYDANLHALKLRSKDGFSLEIELALVISIAGNDAPKMISRVGSSVDIVFEQTIDSLPDFRNSVQFRSIKNLIARVLDPMVMAYFRNYVQEYEALELSHNLNQLQREAMDYLQSVLSGYGVQAVTTFINEIDLPDKLEEIIHTRKFVEEQRTIYQKKQLAEIERKRFAILKSLPTEEVERLQSKVISEIKDDNYIKGLKVETVRGSGMVMNQPNYLVLRLSNSNRETLSPVEIKLSEESTEYEVIGDNPLILSQIEKQESIEVSFKILIKVVRQVAISYRINNVLKDPPIYINVVQDNPYIYGSPVEVKSSFFGRKRELEQIIQAVIKPTKQDILLIGERRTGKTSLLNQIKKRLTGSYIPVYIVLNTIEATTESILSLVIQKVTNSLRKKGFVIDNVFEKELDSSNFLSTFEKIIGSVQPEKLGIKIVLLIDEADYLLQVKQYSSNTVDERAQNILRAALQSSEIGNSLRAVVTATSELSTYVSQRSSPFFNHFRFVKLRLFSTNETRELIVQPASSLEYEYAEESIQRITDLSGGQPYYCQALCYESFNSAMQCERKQITEEDVEVAERKIIEDFFTGYLSGFWNRFNKLEKSFVLALAQGRLNSNTKKSTIKRLLEWQIITKDLQGNYYFPSELIKKWTIMAANE